MEGFWYYAIDGEQTGPLTFAQLTATLSGLPNSRRALLWHASFDGWRNAYEVSELVAVMPDLARPPPLETKIRVEPRTHETGAARPTNSSSEKKSWRKTAGSLFSVVIVAISFAVVREVSRSATTKQLDPARPINGATREAFTKAAMDSCLEKQENAPENKSLRLTHETLASYCSCFVDSLAGSTTYGDLDKQPTNGAISTELQVKIDRASSPCYDNLQRKLMGVSGK
jgi:hypothetical protein